MNFVAHQKSGSVASAMMVSCQERISIAMIAAMKVTLLERIEESVELTAVCTPPTSFEIRDCRSPVRAEA